MTNAEKTTRNPTAKEVAEQALEASAQLRTELTELRTQLREGGTVTLVGGEFAPDPRVDTIDKEFTEFVEHVNAQLAALAGGSGGVVAFDPAPVMAEVSQALQGLEKRVAESFTAQAKIIDSWGTALTAHETNLSEIREAMPSVADLVTKVAALEEWQAAELNEPGTAAGDLNDVHQRINQLRAEMTHALKVSSRNAWDGDGQPVRQVIDLHGNQVPAIYGQVHQLMNLVTELGKNSEADKKMGGYKFRSVDDAMDKVGHALREVGVMFQPREILDRRIERYEIVSKDGFRQNWTHTWVTQRYAFVSLVDGSEMSAIEMDGEARDNGDKATSKADSMRYKYALLQALCIPINGLPESDGRDGTEGGQVYGRGSAGDAFDNASPHRPGEQHVDSRPHEAPEEVENSETASTAYGYGHQPAESPGGRAHAQAAQPPQDDRTPEEKAQAAYNRLVGLAGLEKPAQRPALNAILKGIEACGIGDIEVTGVDGQTVVLGRYAKAVNSQVGA